MFTQVGKSVIFKRLRKSIDRQPLTRQDLLQSLPNHQSRRPVMSLSQRLRQLQVQSVVEPVAVDHLTLEELSSEVVTFGQKFNGRTFEDTWQDQEWIQFMINRYQKSQKESHRRFMKYVELKVEALEQNQGVIPRGSQVGGLNRPQAKAKATAKSHAAPSLISSLGESDWDIPSEMYEPAIMDHRALPASEDWMAMQARMLNMENALTRVIQHLEQQTNPEQINAEDQDQ